MMMQAEPCSIYQLTIAVGRYGTAALKVTRSIYLPALAIRRIAQVKMVPGRFLTRARCRKVKHVGERPTPHA